MNALLIAGGIVLGFNIACLLWSFSLSWHGRHREIPTPRRAVVSCQSITDRMYIATLDCGHQCLVDCHEAGIVPATAECRVCWREAQNVGVSPK